MGGGVGLVSGGGERQMILGVAFHGNSYREGGWEEEEKEKEEEEKKEEEEEEKEEETLLNFCGRKAESGGEGRGVLGRHPPQSP